MKYIVIGGAGFIGRYIVDMLIKNNNEVLVIDNLSSGKLEHVHNKAFFINADIRNKESISSYFDNTIDGVFHVGICHNIVSIENPILMYETNMIGTLNILECCRLNNILKIVLVFSIIPYNNTLYKSSIESIETLVKTYNDIYNFFISCLRVSTIYGKYTDTHMTQLTQNNDYIHILDIVYSCILYMNNTICGIFDVTALNILKWKYNTLCDKPSHKITIITHFYNEEYLLPYWLIHHKTLQAKGFIKHVICINHDSTDNSVELIKKICPQWTIINSKIGCFDAKKTDMECMEIEEYVTGYKMILCITEFLIYPENTQVVLDIENPTCYELSSCVIVSHDKYCEINEIMDSTKHGILMGYKHPRFLHSYSNGNYEVGRHKTKHVSQKTNMYVYCYNLFCLNENMLKRRLQIKERIPESDKLSGAGFHHFWSIDEIDKEYDRLRSCF